MSRSATASGPEEVGLVYRPWARRRAPLQAMQSNRDVASSCSWRRFHQSGVFEPYWIPPLVADWFPPARAGHESACLWCGRPRCRRLGVYDLETHNLPIHAGKHLIQGHQLAQEFRKGLDGLHYPAWSSFPWPREEGLIPTSGEYEVQQPKHDRPTILSQYFGGKRHQILVRGTILCMGTSSVPYYSS